MNTEINRQGPYLDPEPCNFDPQILPKLILQQQLDKEKGEKNAFQLIQGGQEDWDKVCNLYDKSKVPGKEVAKVEVIVNPRFSNAFLSTLETLKVRTEAGHFDPSWDGEPQNLVDPAEETKMRRRVNNKLQ